MRDLTHRAERLGWSLPPGWAVRSEIIGCNCDMVNDDPVTPEALETWLGMAWQGLEVQVAVVDDEGSLWHMMRLGHWQDDDCDPFADDGYLDEMINEALAEVEEAIVKVQGLALHRKA